MNDNLQFNTFLVKVIDGKTKGEFVEMSEDETRAKLESLLPVLGKLVCVSPSNSTVTFNRFQRPLDALKLITFGSRITIHVKD